MLPAPSNLFYQLVDHHAHGAGGEAPQQLDMQAAVEEHEAVLSNDHVHYLERIRSSITTFSLHPRLYSVEWEREGTRNCSGKASG